MPTSTQRQPDMNAITKILTCLVPLAIHAFAHAASGEMGTGVPEFGMYSDATGAEPHRVSRRLFGLSQTGVV